MPRSKQGPAPHQGSARRCSCLRHIRVFAAPTVGPVEQDYGNSGNDEDAAEELVGDLRRPPCAEHVSGEDRGEDGDTPTGADQPTPVPRTNVGYTNGLMP